MLQKYNVEEDPTDPAPSPLSSSLSLFSRLQLELTRTRTRWTRTGWTRGILSTWMKNWNPSFDSVEEVCSPRARRPCLYSLFKWIWAVGSNRHQSHGFPWSLRSMEHDPQSWSCGGKRWAGALRSRAGALSPSPLGFPFVPVASGVF